MANNYTQFSDQILDLTEAEAAWIKEVLEEGGDHYDDEYGGCGFDWAIEGTTLWMYSEECCMLDYLMDFVQSFLAKFRPTTAFSMTWSESCSKPRIGEFGGGAIFVTATAKEWIDVRTWEMNKQEEFKKA